MTHFRCSRRQWLALALCSALPRCALAHDATHPHEPDPEEIALGSLADAELAFAQAARERGWHAALAAFMAADGVAIEDVAVLMRDLAREPRDTRSRFDVHPAQVTVSHAYDLGCATGTYSVTNADVQLAARHGVYVSTWRRDGNHWRIVLATRIPTPALVDFVGLGAAPRPGYARRSAWAAQRTHLLQLESAGGTKRADLPRSADMRIYRANVMPQAAADSLSRTTAPTRQGGERVRFLHLARAADLAVTAGPLHAPDSAWFVHVWLRDANGRWQIAYDVETPARPLPE